MTIKIAIIGPAGSGKTTILSEIRNEFKDRGKSVKVIEEVARASPWNINEDANFNDQRWIFHQQVLKELEIEYKNPDIILCDRCLIDNLAYFERLNVRHEPFPINEYLQIFEIVRLWSRKYDHIIRMPLNLDWLKEDGVRSVNIAFAQDIDNRISILLKEFKLDNIIHYRKNFSVPRFCNRVEPEKKVRKVTKRKKTKKAGIKS